MDQKLIDYIKNGLEKGYRPDHIREILIRHGHQPRSVDNAINFVRYYTPGSAAETKAPQKLQKKWIKGKGLNKTAVATGVLVILLVISILTVSLFSSKNDRITGLTVQLEEEEQKQSASLSQLEQKKSQIEEQIRMIDSLEISVEEKQRLVAEQLRKLDQVNEQIEQERQQTRDLLLEQANYILNKQQDTQ
ncbi:hypothetical protein GF351_04530 [Candidatus Woesearchaeota archaeon]|nr:hypothetical protein [Candidatus Woesearchaeota archaeon]